MIPNIAHFVFGLGDAPEPFHPLHAVAIASCQRVLAPERIYFHYRHLPFGRYWDEVAPFLTLHQVELSPEVLGADYSPLLVPREFRYAHHADFVRLDALIEHGGVYADIDTVFLRPFPSALFDQPFVIGREPSVRDERTGVVRPSLCNALLMSEPGSAFARAWRAEMAGALNGTWSNHSGFLSERLSREMPEAVSVVAQSVFFPFSADGEGLVNLLERLEPVPDEALSVHLWAHLWWDQRRLDRSRAHGGWCTPAVLRHAPTTLAEMVRPYLPNPGSPTGRSEVSTTRWRYLALDERSGYGVAGDRCRTALEESGLEVDWFPFVPGPSWGLGYEPAFPLAGRDGTDAGPDADEVVVAHLVPEYLPLVRRSLPVQFLVGHTVWETDRLPGHWPRCLDHADLIVVPSTFAQRVLSDAGLATAVEVVPHAATDPGAPADDRWLEVDEDVVVFYTIAEWNERKAVDRTIKAFLRGFRSSDRVTLVVKTSPRDHEHPETPTGRLGPGTAAFALARLVAGHPDPPPIRLVTRELSDAEVAGLHRRGDCFLSLCRSEGWGLGAFDAATYGNPVVTTGFGGHLDYLGASPFLVGYDLVPVSVGVPSSYTADQQWAEPDVEQAAAMCRQIAEDPALARSSAGALAQQLQATYRPTEIARAFRAAIDRHRRGSSGR